MNWLDDIKWNDKGLIPVITQEAGTGDVLMFAWMNRESLQKTAELRQAVYFSRSRGHLWHKGEESGNFQTVHEIRLDCDNDVILLKVTQPGSEAAASGQPGELDMGSRAIACHTGRHSCFFRLFKDGQWLVTEPVLKDPGTTYT